MWRRVAAAGLLCAGLGACSSASEASSGSASSAGESVATSAVESTTSDPGTGSTVEPADPAPADASPEAASAYQSEVVGVLRVVEEETAVCMGGLGFEYQPEPVSVEAVFGSAGGGWVSEESGYGQVDRAFTGRGAGLNGAYFDSLSAAEQEVYRTSLVGEVPLPEPYDALASPRAHFAWVTFVAQTDAEGCLGDALAEHQLPIPGAGGSVEDYLAQEERMGSDPEYVEMVEAWASCMADRGFYFATPLDAENSILMAVGQMQTSGAGEPSEEDVSAIRQLERETSTADIACGGLEIRQFELENEN